MLKKTVSILFVITLFLVMFVSPVSAAGRYFNTGKVSAAEWDLSVSRYDSSWISLSVSDYGDFYQFSLSGLSIGDTAVFQLMINTGRLSIYESETLHGLLNIDAFSSGGGWQLTRSKVVLFDSSTGDTFSPGWGAIGANPDGSLPSNSKTNLQVGFDTAADFSFDTLLVDFEYKKSRSASDLFRVYKSSYFQLYTGDLDSELLSEMVDEQKVTNDKLDELIGAGEKEKDEATDTGDDGVGEITDVIPDYSTGFIEGMGNLVSALSYTGTECIWKFPQLYIPEMDGISGQISLTDSEMDIDISQWVNSLPSALLTVVRSVLTIALILFCVRELYNTIQYVLTLKGGGS